MRTDLSTGLSIATSLLMLDISAVCLQSAVAAPVLFDPTQPYSSSAATSPTAGVNGTAPVLKLQAILVGTDRRLAIINDQLVHEGAQLAGASIASISANSVRYTYRGQSHDLCLTTAPPLRITRTQQDTKP